MSWYRWLLIWAKKGNIFPIHKKGDKQTLKDYRPVSLLRICGKTLEQLIFNEMFQFLSLQINLVLNQVTFASHTKFVNLFHEGHEIRGVFLDISKIFDKVWHDNIIFKLPQNVISENSLKLLRNFWSERTQRVVANDQVTAWAIFTAGVPQGSILVPWLFIIYVNDLSEELSTNAKLFADDTSLFSVSANDLNKDLEMIHNWAFQWKMNFKPERSY